MTRGKTNQTQTKISSEFMARLDRLKSAEKVRAIVMLHTPDVESSGSRRQNAEERGRAVAAVRKSAEAVLPKIDEILKRFGGRRLTDEVDALGTVSVEATRAGVSALAASDHVSVILEDQPVSLKG
jgi:hypothetical protein